MPTLAATLQAGLVGFLAVWVLAPTVMSWLALFLLVVAPGYALAYAVELRRRREVAAHQTRLLELRRQVDALLARQADRARPP